MKNTDEVVSIGSNVLEVFIEEVNFREFLLPSGDGYTEKEFAESLAVIKNHVRQNDNISIYAGPDYEHVPFDSIYKLWNEVRGFEHYKKPTKESYNSYDHGFILVTTYY
jgi:hypothetical protein